MSEPLVRFGRFEVDRRAAELRRNGVRVPLQELPFRLLCALLERPGEVITRQELRERLWPADVYVDFDNSINAAMSRLREILGDTALNPRFVATEPRRGFRFIAPVEHVEDGPVPVAHVVGSAGRRRRRLALLLGTLAALGGAAAVGLGLQSARAPAPQSPRPDRPLLAVLPFKDLGAAPDQEYLGDGLTEELISRLGGVSPRRLGVVARASVMRFRDKPVDQVASELGVRYVVEGSVRRERDSVHITVRLIDAGDQSALWSEAFDERFSDMLPLQTEIANRVAGALAGELLGPTPPPGPGASRASRGHELYWRGRQHLNRQTPAAFEKALAAFSGAIAEDPEDAAAHRGLAETYIALGEYDVRPTREAFPQAAAAARRALALEPGSAESQLVLGQVRFHDERDWAGAERALQQVLRLNPSLARAHALYAHFLSASARHDEALAEMQEARRLDPLSLIVNADLCWTHFLARRYAQAAAQCEATLELDPHFLPAQDNLKWVLIQMGRAGPAAEAFCRVVSLEGDSAASVVNLRKLYDTEGMPGLHRASLHALLERARIGYQSPYDVALEYAALGKRASAIEWLERSFEAGETDLAALGVDPRLDPLRREPRFAHLLARVGVPVSLRRPEP